ncbi:MAG: ankyrin repeat domain-containing protein [Chlamydiota bacterium]
MKGKKEALKKLLESKYLKKGLKHKNCIGNLVHLAIAFKKHDILEYLVCEKNELTKELIEEENDEGQTPLMLASYIGNTWAMTLLIKKYTHLLDAKSESGRTPLHWAALGRQTDSIERLDHFSPYFSQDSGNKPPIYDISYL